MTANQLDSNTQKELEHFLYSKIADIAKYHSVDPEMFLKTKISFHFVDGEHYKGFGKIGSGSMVKSLIY